jgi:hypothetical protein
MEPTLVLVCETETTVLANLISPPLPKTDEGKIEAVKISANAINLFSFIAMSDLSSNLYEHTL